MNNDTKDPTQQTYSIEKLAMKIKSKHVSKLKVELIRNACSKSKKNPTKSNLNNKNIELTHIKCRDVDGQFHIWCESSVISSGLVLAFCFMVVKWLLQL